MVTLDGEKREQNHPGKRALALEYNDDFLPVSKRLDPEAGTDGAEASVTQDTKDGGTGRKRRGDEARGGRTSGEIFNSEKSPRHF